MTESPKAETAIVHAEDAVGIVPTGIPMVPIEELRQLTAYVNKVKETLMDEGKDYIVQGGKQYTTRSGYAKLSQGFNLSDEILEEKKIWKNDEFYGFDFTVRVTNQHGRQNTGVGSCTVDEPNLMRHKERPYHDCRSIAYTRAWNRAVSNFVGSADVSAEEMSMGDNFNRKDVKADVAIELPNLETPTWDLTAAIKAEGWDQAEEALGAYLRDMGFHVPENVFEWGKDTVKLWIKNASGIFFGPFQRGRIDAILREAGFSYSSSKLWRLNKSDIEGLA